MGKSDLALDSIFEILSLLPAKSLLRFESVSKSWCSLIHNPLFVTHHLHQTAKTNSNYTLISLDGDNIHFSGVDCPGITNTFNYNNHRPVDIIGSCNGLLCLSIFRHGYVVISNLLLVNDCHFTRVPNNLPTDNHQLNSYYFGFGYDSVNDDYKVVIIVSSCEDEFNSSNTYAESTIYSLRSNSWSEIKSWDKDFPEGKDTDGVLVSGALNWLAMGRRRRDEETLLIIAFDLGTEDEFYQVSLPENVNGWDIRLGVLKGCLCFSTRALYDQLLEEGQGHRWDIYFADTKRYHDIWVMEEYNNIQASWTKLLRLDMCCYSWTNLRPLIYSTKGDRALFLEENKQGLYWYDVRNREVVMESVISRYPINDDDGWMFPFFHRFYAASVCLSSLVSLSDYKALWKKKKKEDSGGGKRKRRSKDESSSTNDDDDDGNGTKAQALQVFLTFRDNFILFLRELTVQGEINSQ